MGASATLQATELLVTPGTEQAIELRVRNTGTVVDQFTFQPIGLAAGWISVEPPQVSLFPGAEGLALTFAGGARLVRSPDVRVRVDGNFIGPGCDLVHGDVIEIPGPADGAPLRLEIE